MGGLTEKRKALEAGATSNSGGSKVHIFSLGSYFVSGMNGVLDIWMSGGSVEAIRVSRHVQIDRTLRDKGLATWCTVLWFL